MNIIEILLIFDFCSAKTTEGDTPPAPIIKALLFLVSLISFKYAACKPKTSVFSPTRVSESSRKIVFTEFVNFASLIKLSTKGIIFCLNGNVTLMPASSLFLILSVIFLRLSSSVLRNL